MDDVPVGGGSSAANKMPDEFESKGAAAQVDNSGPLEERLVSKNWSVRA
jgi:hypothetical protein